MYILQYITERRECMKVKIKRFDKNLPLPSYKTKGAACVDVYAREGITIAPHTVGYIPLNVAIEIPEGYWLMLAARGSTHKSGIIPANGIGIGDWDFRGDNDEYKMAALNFTDKEVVIEKGARIGQMMLMKYEMFEFEEVEHLGNEDRGSFGSTGHK
jgi:dUTP pyrophosphatase